MGGEKGIAGIYRRMRHTKGFGVHSPLGYDFVKTVVSPGSEKYYGYQDIRDKCLEENILDRSLRKEAEMLLRMAVFIRARSVFLPPDSPSLFRTALLAADSRMVFLTEISDIGKSDLTVVTPGLLKETDIAGIPAAPENNIFFHGTDEAACRSVYGRMKGGIWFRGNHNSVILIRDNIMSKLTYTVSI